MNMSRWIVVPITAAVVLGIGYGIGALLTAFVTFANPGMVKLIAAGVLVAWYLVDSFIRSRRPA